MKFKVGEKEVFEITKNVIANFIDDEDKFVKQQIIDHIIQNGKYYDVINISKLRVKEIVENGLKYKQLKKENEELKSAQNSLAVEKLEELKNSIHHMYWKDIYDKINSMVAEIKTKGE